MRYFCVLIMCVLLAACGSSPKKGGAGTGAYTVVRGDTLTKIARQHGQSVNELMRANNLRNPHQIKVGQVLKVKGGAATPAAGLPSAGSGTAQSSPATRAPAVAAPRKINLIWPASGSHRQGTGSQSQGIFIAGSAGSPIKAAAAGKVMYAGSGLRGYGNMVILSHPNNFISVYAHNQSLSVKEGQSVNQGQTIAQMGSSDTNTTQLYFELRYNGKAVSVLPHLPSK